MNMGQILYPYRYFVSFPMIFEMHAHAQSRTRGCKTRSAFRNSVPRYGRVCWSTTIGLGDRNDSTHVGRALNGYHNNTMEPPQETIFSLRNLMGVSCDDIIEAIKCDTQFSGSRFHQALYQLVLGHKFSRAICLMCIQQHEESTGH